VHVIGQIGNLQTPAVAVTVTVAPTTLVAGPPPTPPTIPNGTDSASSLGTATISAIVRGLGDSAIAGAIVTFSILHQPPARSGDTFTTYLADPGGNPSVVDTTDGSGTAGGRHITVIGFFLGTTNDSVVVQMSAKYKGVPLTGSPLTVTVPVKVTF
jgi:hypothetical protein